MADSVLSLLLHNLPKLLIQETKFLAGVEDRVNLLLNELSLLNAFLKDPQGKNEIGKEIVGQIRELAHEAEYVIDAYIANVEKQRRRSITRKVGNFVPSKRRLRRIGKKINRITEEFKRIYKGILVFGTIRNIADLSMNAKEAEVLDKHRRNVDLEDVVGFVDDSNTLVEQLTEGQLERDVSSIVGMGGLGKSTLAKKVYNNVRVQNHFNCRAWVYVSQDFRSKELLIKIFKSEMLTSESNYHVSQNPALIDEQSKTKLEDLSEEELKDELANYLQGKKYLVVLDDVWTTEVWDEIKSAFPPNSNGSRILITSRNECVASYGSRGTLPYRLPVLNKDDSWELLRKKAFRGQDYPSELETVGRKIAEGCHGLPLSIVVLGGLLAKKEKKTHEWEKYINHGNWHLTRENQCKGILALSYTHLPEYLKQCFLYAGVYPKGHEIPVRQLIQLWIAEGFIQNTDGRNMEDVAEIYLRELIDRSLIQVARRTGEAAKTCRIHDLLRELCLSKSKEDKFYEVRTDDNHKTTKRTYRLSILCSPSKYISSNDTDPSLARSLLFFDQDTWPLEKEKNHWKWVLKNFSLVRVLNFGRITFSCIPTNIEEMIHLKYLRIESEELDAIPASLCNLWNLETLDARSSRLKCLPIEIWKLQRLRNLYMSGPVSFPYPSNTDVKPLGELQVLSTIIVDQQTASLMTDGKLPNVRKLGICYSWRQSVWKRESLPHLPSLQTLKIIDCSELLSLPNSISETITKITLNRVPLFKNMEMLGNLPKLRILKLQDCIFHISLRVIADSFRKLEVLILDNLPITQWKLEKGAMPGLVHLVIKKCKYLINLPPEICNMTSLRDVEVLWTSLKLARLIQQLQSLVEFKLQIYPPPDDVFYRSSS